MGRMWLVLWLAAVGIIVAMAPRGHGQTEQIVTAQGFRIVDAAGRVRGLWKGDSLVLSDGGGKAHTSIGADSNGNPFVALRDKAGNNRVVLGLNKEEEWFAAVSDATGKKQAYLTVNGLARIP